MGFLLKLFRIQLFPRARNDHFVKLRPDKCVYCRLAHGKRNFGDHTPIGMIAAQSASAAYGAPIASLFVHRGAVRQMSAALGAGEAFRLSEAAVIGVLGRAQDFVGVGMRPVKGRAVHAPRKAVMQIGTVGERGQAVAEREPAHEFRCRGRISMVRDRVEHDPDPETPSSIADSLVEAKQIRVERRRSQQRGRSRPEIKLKNPATKGNDGSGAVGQGEGADIRRRPPAAPFPIAIHPVQRRLLHVDPEEKFAETFLGFAT
jgi:hypothetical protein